MGINQEFLGAVLLFMVGTVFAFMWGRRRGESPEKVLQQKLLDATTKKVVKHLEKNEFITADGVAKLIRGTIVRDAWYRKMMRIDDPQTYAKGLVRILLEKDTIQYAGKDGYCLKKRRKKNKKEVPKFSGLPFLIV